MKPLACVAVDELERVRPRLGSSSIVSPRAGRRRVPDQSSMDAVAEGDEARIAIEEREGLLNAVVPHSRGRSDRSFASASGALRSVMSRMAADTRMPSSLRPD